MDTRYLGNAFMVLQLKFVFFQMYVWGTVGYFHYLIIIKYIVHPLFYDGACFQNTFKIKTYDALLCMSIMDDLS